MYPDINKASCCSVFVSAFSIAHFHNLPRILYEPRAEKTGLRGFRPGPTQTGLYCHIIWLEA